MKEIENHVKLTEPGVVGMPPKEEREPDAPTNAPETEPPPGATDAPAPEPPAAGTEGPDKPIDPKALGPAGPTSSPMGSVSNFDDIPIRLLNTFFINDLTKHNEKMGNGGMKTAKLGQIGTMAALGHLGHLGGVLVGRVWDLGAVPKFTTSHFGAIGELPLELLAKLGPGKLGILDHMTIGQLLRLARIGMLKRMTMGHIVHIIPVTASLKADIKAVVEGARQQKADLKDKVSEVPEDKKKQKKVRDEDVPAIAFHMPKVDQVYDMITLIHVLQTSVQDLKKDYCE